MSKKWGHATSLSIIIPTYNEEKNISNCLSYIAANKYPNNKVEIIIIDGGSIDGTINKN